MKKSVAIFFLCLYLFGTTEAHQLLKLPLLVQHFAKHKAENPQTTFFSFIKIHYIDPVVFDEDYAQDMQLPFKTLNADAMCLMGIPSLPSPKFEVAIVATPVVKQTIPLSNDTQYYFLSTQDIFQPPKTV